VQQALVCWSV